MSEGRITVHRQMLRVGTSTLAARTRDAYGARPSPLRRRFFRACSMKSPIVIATPTALRPYGLGTAACGLPRDERAPMDFIHHD